MIFEQIMESEDEHEILCPYFLRYHLRKDGQLTIYEIWVSKEMRGIGVGKELLESIKQIQGVVSIFAKCPTDLPSNSWYEKNGFILEGKESLKSGRTLNLWRLKLI